MTQELIKAYEKTGYSDRAICYENGIKLRTFRRWLAGKQSPNHKSQKKIQEIIEVMSRTPPIPRHPSYGYATPDQIKRLEQIGMGPERDQILKQIAKQNETSGKTRF